MSIAATPVYTVNLTVSVWDKQALRAKAADLLLAEGHKGRLTDLIGTKRSPNVGACLQMLLDRSEHLAGAEIESSESEALDETGLSF